MPLGSNSILQSNKGSFNGASGTVSLPGNTTADSTVVLIAATGNNMDIEPLDPPTGFTQAGTVVGGISQYHCYPFVFYKKTNGGESSWTLPFDSTGSGMVCWHVFEVEALDLETPALLTTEINPGSDDINPILTTNSTGTTQSSASYDVMAFAIHPTFRPGTTSVGVDGHTNGFVELAQQDLNDGTNAMSLSVAMKTSQVLQSYESTASFDAACWSQAMMVVFTAEEAKYAPDISNMTGFEFGTTANWTTTSPVSGCQGMAIFDSAVGSPAVVTTSPKTGAYCLELASTSAAESVAWNNPGGLLVPNNGTEQVYPVGVARFNVYFPTSLPSADVELASLEAGSLANGVTVWYRTASQKIGVKVGSGTEVLSDATVSADKWIGVDLKFDPRTTTHKCDWQVDYDTSAEPLPVAQTQATRSGGTVGNITTFRLGHTNAVTATVRYDDVAISSQRKSYPINDFNVRLLKVDPSGTPTTDGDTDWRVFTSNGGTLSAWTAAGARAALDEVPPVVGASADGIAQINSGINYATIPFETYTAAPTEVHRAAKIYLSGWAASSSVATFQGNITDGENLGTFFGSGDHNFDNAINTWMVKMVKLGLTGFYILSQARVDGLTVKVGGSTDANPDVGINAAFVELMTQVADVYNVIAIENGAFTVDVRQDPLSQSVASYLVTVPAGSRGATAYFTISGTESSHHVDPNVSNPVTYTKVIGATGIDEVQSVGLTPDP